MMPSPNGLPLAILSSLKTFHWLPVSCDKKKGATAISPRGEPSTSNSIKERLSVRSFLEELRGAGVAIGGPPALHARDCQAFAAQLDRWLAAQPRT